MTTMDEVPCGALSTDQLAHYLADRRARHQFAEQFAGPSFADEWERLRVQAQAYRIAWAMVTDDGFPGALVYQVLTAAFPGCEDVVADAVADAVAVRVQR